MFSSLFAIHLQSLEQIIDIGLQLDVPYSLRRIHPKKRHTSLEPQRGYYCSIYIQYSTVGYVYEWLPDKYPAISCDRIPDNYSVISGARIPDKYPVISGARIPDKYNVLSKAWCCRRHDAHLTHNECNASCFTFTCSYPDTCSQSQYKQVLLPKVSGYI